MSDNVLNLSEPKEEKIDEYIEDEFGLGLKIFLLARLVFCGLCAFMVLGALVCVVTGFTPIDVLISSATGFGPAAVDQNYDGYKICMFAQAAYSIISPVLVFMFMKNRSKLLAVADLVLFVVFIGISVAMGALFLNPVATGNPCLFTNGSAWFFYLIFNPVWSFIALFAGKHFKYMPLK